MEVANFCAAMDTLIDQDIIGYDDTQKHNVLSCVLQWILTKNVL